MVLDMLLLLIITAVTGSSHISRIISSNIDPSVLVRVVGSTTAASSTLAGYTNSGKGFYGPSDYDPSEIVTHVDHRAQWLCHGAVAFLGSIFTVAGTGMPLSHTYVVMKTNRGRYYTTQWDKNIGPLLSGPHYSLSSADKFSNPTSDPGKEVSSRGDKNVHTSMRDVFEKVKDEYETRHGNYDVTSCNCNCQGYSADFYRWID